MRQRRSSLTASADGRLDWVKIVIPATTSSACRRAASTSARRTVSLEQEARLQDFKRDAMLAFVRANNSTTPSCPAGVSRRSA